MNDSEKENIKLQYQSPSQSLTILKQASFISSTDPNLSLNHTFRCIKKRIPWSEEEDKAMKQLVNKYGTSNWTLISSKMGKARNGKQCRERWYNQLNPSMKKNNWTINGNSFNNGLTLIKNDKTSVSLTVVNKDFDSDVKVGIINLKDKRREILDCETWGITVNNEHAMNPVTFKLAKGITNGSTKEDIIKAYGELSADKIKTLDDRVILQYQKDYSVYLDLTIINDKGLTSFSYKKY